MLKKDDRYWMRKALRLAERGMGTTSPNPMVGAVIVKQGKLLGQGWHVRPGEAHAEVNAIRSLKNPASSKNATIYVTLEPCSSWGRTPPCCEALIRGGFSRVVIGSIDPNPKHAGKAVELLRSHGIEVVSGVEKQACDHLNRAFFKWIQHKKPFVILKMAETLDGKTACVNGCSQWITSDTARKRVQKLRLQSDVVMAGAGTYRQDHPRFTVRKDDGTVIKTPRRIIVSNHPEKLDFPDDSWETVSLPTDRAWQDFLDRLGGENVTCILLEGGGELAASALQADVVDEVEFHIATKILGGRNSKTAVDGVNPLDLQSTYQLKAVEIRKLGCDLMIRGSLH